MIRQLGNIKPEIHQGAFIHEQALVIGDVMVEEDANIWPGAILRGDIERITIGRGASIQDGTIIHTDPGFPVEVGEWTAVGHGCTVHGCSVGNNSLVGMGAILLTGSKVGNQCIIGAGALVPEGMVIQDGFIALGIPAKIVRKVEERDRKRIEETVNAYQKLMRRHSTV